jgi:hypothetical protein
VLSNKYAIIASRPISTKKSGVRDPIPVVQQGCAGLSAGFFSFVPTIVLRETRGVESIRCPSVGNSGAGAVDQ